MKVATADLLLLLSHTALSTAISIPRQSDATILDIQPNLGGSTADDCGDGKPVTFDEATWAANGVDAEIDSVWQAGKSDPKFDMHQAFARKYGVSLFCPNIFSTCTGDPSSCSQLKGTVVVKKRGWLGIKAILNLQEQFLNMEKVMSLAADELMTGLSNFQQIFSPPDPPEGNEGANLGVNVLSNAFTALLGIGVASASTTIPALTPVVAAGLTGLGGGLSSVIGSAINDARADGSVGPTDLSIFQLSDSIATFKKVMLTGLDLGHNATFSNGKAGDHQAPELPTVLKGGAFVGNLVPQAYSREQGGLLSFVRGVMTAKLLQATWTAQDSFLYRVVDATDPVDCANWFNSGGQSMDVKLCYGDKGLFVLRSVVKEKGVPTGRIPHGANNKDVSEIGGLNIQLRDLIQSAADQYLAYGLTNTEFGNYLPEIIKAWAAGFKDTFYKWAGMFTLPICEVTRADWEWVSEGSVLAPCKCRFSKDPYGEKFYDVASPLIKEYMDNMCQ